MYIVVSSMTEDSFLSSFLICQLFIYLPSLLYLSPFCNDYEFHGDVG